MSRRERFVIHGLLILLVLGMLPNLVGLTTGEAIAAASRWVADLGPAESVTLVDPGGGDDVVLRNREGHAAWGDDAFHRAHAIAFVHISKVLNRLLQAEAMTDERDALREAAEEEDAGFRRRFEAFEREHADITPEDPQAEAVFNRYRELRNEYDRWQSEQRAKLAALGADQIERAYRDLVAAVDVVASKKRIDIVYRFIPTNDPFQAPTPDAAQAAVSLRTALKYPSGLDITPEILDELALDDE